MPPTYRVALLGFNAFERSALASYLRLNTERSPRYEHVLVLSDADLMVADGDHPPSVQLVEALERLPDTVFVGARSPAGAHQHLARPIEPMRVVRALDALVAASRRQPASTGSAPAPDPTPVRAVAAVQAQRRPAAAAQQRAAPARAPAPPAVPRPPPPPPPPPRALLVDDSELARRYLQTRLKPFGLETDAAGHADEALALLTRSSYDFVFLDMELGERSTLDGLGLCRRIKLDSATRMPPCTIVMVSAHCGELDRVRGALAGCDAFLGKPLDERELGRLLARHDIKPAATAR